MAKDRGKSWLLSPIKKSSITHHAEENRMASPNQTVVDKGLPNPLIAEDLLKILRDLISFDSSRILYQFPSMKWWIHKISHVKPFTSDFSFILRLLFSYSPAGPIGFPNKLWEYYLLFPSEIL